MSAILLNSHSHRRRSDHFLCALLDCSLKGRLGPHALQPLMVSQRSLRLHTWWWKDHNPGRHLVLAPFNGATAASGTPYFTENPGDPRKAWDASAPSITCPANTSLSAGSLTIELRVSLIFLGRTESPLRVATLARRDSLVSGFTPDLRRDENRLSQAILVKFQVERQKVIKSS